MVTLSNLPEATEQEVFDQVVRHLLTQNARSTDSITGYCQYRGNNNTKCAGGCLISDDEYSPKMEDVLWVLLVDDKLIPEHKTKELIGELQKIHDSIEPDRWLHELRILASIRRLPKDVFQEFEPTPTV